MSEVTTAPSAPAEQAPASESNPSSDPKSTVSPQSEKVQVKLDGKKVSIDKNALALIVKEIGITEEAFLRDYGTGADATRKAQEAAKLRKEIDAEKERLANFWDNLKAKPEAMWELAEKLGIDPEKLAEERVWKKIQYEKMSPEGRQALEEKRRADAAEQRLKDIETAEKEKNSQAVSKAAEEEIESDVMKVLELTKRKAEPGLIRRVAEIYESYMLAKKTKPSHEYVVNKLRDYRRQEFTEDLEGTDIEELMNTLPKGFVSKFQDYLVQKARTKDLPSHTPSGSAPSTTKQKQKAVNIDDFFKSL